MLTGYWTIDVFIIANIALILLVSVIFFFYHKNDGGKLELSPKYPHTKESER